MALIYTAITASMTDKSTTPWYNIKETCLAPSAASYEVEGKTSLSEQRLLYHAWLDARFTIDPTSFHDLSGSRPVIITSNKPHPSTDYRGWAVEWLAKLSKMKEIDFRYGGELFDGRINRVIVSGSREMSTNLYNTVNNKLWPYIKSGYRLVVGDAAGVDNSAQLTAMLLFSIMEIWFPGSLGIRNHPDDKRLSIYKPVHHPSDDARVLYIHRTKEMVLSGDPEYNRDVFLAFWDGQSKGTKAAIIQARKMGYDHGYVFVEAIHEIRQIEINSPDLEPWLKEK